MARAFGQKEPRGALVGDVSANSPAARSGLEKGDIILEVNGKPVANSNDFRSGSERAMAVKLGELPATEAAVQHQGKGSSGLLSGVSVENLDTESARQLGLPASSQGVVVTNVSPNSRAAEAGRRRSDVIQEVNRKPVKNTSDLDRAAGASKEETLLLINRHGSTMYLAV